MVVSRGRKKKNGKDVKKLIEIRSTGSTNNGIMSRKKKGNILKKETVKRKNLRKNYKKSAQFYISQL